jgi:hypothetical protein
MKTMKVFALIAAIAVALFGGVEASAQGSLTPAAQAPVMIKPKLKVAHIKGAASFINGIEIRGGEVDAFLDVRKVLTSTMQPRQRRTTMMSSRLKCVPTRSPTSLH